jgi:hypothetical protein
LRLSVEGKMWEREIMEKMLMRAGSGEIISVITQTQEREIEATSGITEATREDTSGTIEIEATGVTKKEIVTEVLSDESGKETEKIGARQGAGLKEGAVRGGIVILTMDGEIMEARKEKTRVKSL